MAAWHLSSWLVLARTFQLLGSLVCAVLGIIVIVVVYTRTKAFYMNMVVLQILICVVLLYTTVAVLLQRSARRSAVTAWLVAFVVLDVLFSAVLIAVLTILANAGLPSNCRGLARSSSDDDDSPAKAIALLGKFCAFERAFFFISVGILFLLVASVVLTMVRLYEKSCTENSHGKGTESPEPSDGSTTLLSFSSMSPVSKMAASSPLSEGILTRATSIRSAMTSSTRNAGRSHRASIQRPAFEAGGGAGVGRGMGGFAPGPVDDDDDDGCAEAALVVDGMQHRRDDDNGTTFYSPHHRDPPPRMPMLTEDEEELQLQQVVADGMRPSEPSLPPYQPGSTRMPGHAGESNEMRLSEYVKGQTRAQRMKDLGGD